MEARKLKKIDEKALAGILSRKGLPDIGDFIREGRSMDVNLWALSVVLELTINTINTVIDTVNNQEVTDSLKQEIATQVLDKVLKLQKQPKKFIMKKKGK